MIEASFRSTYEEWLEGQTLWCKSSLSRSPYAKLHRAVKNSLAVLAGASAVLPPHWPGAILLAILVLDWIVAKWRKPKIMRWLFDRDPDREQHVNVMIDDAGYTSFREGLTECRMTWASFSGWKEGPLTVILGRHGKYCFIPKRVISEEQLILLRKLCQTNVRTHTEGR